MKTVPACPSVFKLLTLVNSVLMVSSFAGYCALQRLRGDGLHRTMGTASS